MIADLSNVKMHMHMMICIRLSVTIVSYRYFLCFFFVRNS